MRDTSLEAYENILKRAGNLRQAVKYIFDQGEFTADEVADVLGCSILSVRPRVAELANNNEIEDSGERRRNASGRNAIVWREKWKGDLFQI
tara:strand:+ start:2971 stop:3243 length:273 start_codon:yes stop_codon:yes gene_type:complete